jgi:hypothetical protein
VLEFLVRTGRKPASVIDGPEVSRPVAYLWGWYMELARTAHMTEHGPQPIGYPDIEAWARLTGRNPMAHEVEALLMLDMALRVPGKEGE